MTKTAVTIRTTNGGVDNVLTNLNEEQVLLLNSFLQGQPVHLISKGINHNLTFETGYDRFTLHHSRLAGITLN